MQTPRAAARTSATTPRAASSPACPHKAARWPANYLPSTPPAICMASMPGKDGQSVDTTLGVVGDNRLRFYQDLHFEYDVHGNVTRRTCGNQKAGISAGVLNLGVFLGRWFNCLAIASRPACE